MRKIQKIIQDVVQRWKDTVEGRTPINVSKAREILAAYAKNKPVFEVETPKQFYIAQAVMRGRMSKERATEVCAEINTDANFLKQLRKTGGVSELMSGNSWWRRNPTNILDNVMQDVMLAATTGKKIRLSRWRGQNNADETLNRFALCHLNSLYSVFIGVPWNTPREATSEERARLSSLQYQLGFNRSRCVERAIITRYDAVSGTTTDIRNNQYAPENHWFDGIHAEIISRAMNVKDIAATACYEIFHHIPAFMHFRKGFLLLTAAPKVHLNAENLLHNETGPAIEFLDDRNFWFVDGHSLTRCGEKIVMASHTLTVEDIAAIDNEEERRIAIDRYGWGKYLQDSGGQVLDYRENWVDNTVEVLIEPGGVTDVANWNWRRAQPLRMVLACRSTGRKYFIAVPNDTAALRGELQDPLNNAPKSNALPKPDCVLAQKWLSDGGTCEFLPYAKHSLNIVGAS